MGVFSDADNTIRGPNASFSLSFRHFVFLKDGKIFCHQPMLNFVRGNSESNFESDFIVR